MLRWRANPMQHISIQRVRRWLVYGIFLAAVSEAALVFHFQTDIWRAPSTRVYARYNFTQKPAETVERFTVCYRMLLHAASEGNVHVSYENSPGVQNTLLLMDSHRRLLVTYNGVNYYTAYEVEPLLRKWQHYCHVYDTETIASFHNSVLVAETKIRPDTKMGITLNGTLIVGQEQDSLSGGFDIDEVLRGSLAQVEIFNLCLTPGEISRLHQCQDVQYPRLFSSDVDDLELFEVETSTFSIRRFCEETTNFVLFADAYTPKAAAKLCARTGGKPFVPEDEAENRDLFTFVVSPFHACYPGNIAWLPVRRNAVSKSWRRTHDNSSLENIFVAKSLRAADNESECAVIGTHLSLPLWEAVSCSMLGGMCAPCTYSNRPSLTLKGLCFDQKHLRTTYVYGYRNRRPYFYCLAGLIVYREAGYNWVIFDVARQEIVASVSLTQNVYYPVGRRLWQVQAQSLCHSRRDSTMFLTLSPCDETMFTCDSGDCIPNGSLCDGITHCRDMSDENYCKIVIIPDNYDSEYPTKDEVSHLVYSDLVVVRLLNINDSKHWISAEVEVTFSWTDERLSFVNLQEETARNALTVEEIKQIWTPSFRWNSTVEGEIAVFSEQVLIEKNGSHFKNDYNSHREDSVYAGSSGVIIYKQNVGVKFSCNFGIYRYPFDSHRCQLALTSKDANDRVRFLPKRSQPEPQSHEPLSSFSVVKISRRVTSEGGVSFMQVVVRLERLSGVPLVAVMLPSCQLATVAYSTLFIRPSLLQVRLPLTLSTLLMLVTLFRSAMKTLPKTAYVKVLDGWFLAVIGFVGLVTLAHVASEFLPVTRTAPAADSASAGSGRSGRRAAGLKQKRRRAAKKHSQKLLRNVRIWIIPPACTVIIIFIWSLRRDPDQARNK